MTQKTPTSDAWANIVAIVYAVGVTINWTYYIAIGWPADGPNDVLTPVLIGFFYELHQT